MRAACAGAVTHSVGSGSSSSSVEESKIRVTLERGGFNEGTYNSVCTQLLQCASILQQLVCARSGVGGEKRIQ